MFRSLKIAALPGPDKSGGRLRPRFEAGGAVRHFVSSGGAATDPPEPRLCVCESGRMTDVGIEHTTPMTHYPCEVDVHVVRTSSTINSAIGINHVQSPSMPRSDMAVAWQGEHLGRHASCAVGAVAGKVARAWYLVCRRLFRMLLQNRSFPDVCGWIGHRTSRVLVRRSRCERCRCSCTHRTGCKGEHFGYRQSLLITMELGLSTLSSTSSAQ